jgi:putative acetyltransferase
MTSHYALRPAKPADHDALGRIMFRAIHDGDSPYSQAQRRAWLPQPNSGAEWLASLSAHSVILAERGADIVGFMSMDGTGYINLAYILPDARGQGLFAAFLHALEARARADGLSELSTHASLMAQPAFARHGFEVVQNETIRRNGETLHRAEMQKTLSGVPR